jgi:hypothetical protein
LGVPEVVAPSSLTFAQLTEGRLPSNRTPCAMRLERLTKGTSCMTEPASIIAERDGLDQGIVGHQRVLRQGYGIGRDCHRLLRAVVRRRGQSCSALALEEARRAQPGRVLGSKVAVPVRAPLVAEAPAPLPAIR